MEELEKRVKALEAQVKKLNELILMQAEINTRVAEILKD